jgi:hypothetical protein
LSAQNTGKRIAIKKLCVCGRILYDDIDDEEDKNSFPSLPSFEAIDLLFVLPAVEIAKLVMLYAREWCANPPLQRHLHEIHDKGEAPFHVSINESCHVVTVKKRGDCCRCWQPWKKWELLSCLGRTDR